MSRNQPILRATFLGTGTSVGIPVITCSCVVCRSADARNQRLRASLLLEWPAPTDDGWARVLVDTSTDLRQQALRAGISRIDGVIYTHAHADHVLGLDELRIYNFVHRRPIPLYGNEVTLESIRQMFGYAFEPGVGVPRLEPRVVGEEATILGVRVAFPRVRHGEMDVLAVRIGGFGYVTDCNGIPEQAAARLADLDVLVIDALRRDSHRTHFSLDEALREIERLAPRRAYLTHLSHVFDHAALEAELPDGVAVAHDGMSLDLPIPGEWRCA